MSETDINKQTLDMAKRLYEDGRISKEEYEALVHSEAEALVQETPAAPEEESVKENKEVSDVLESAVDSIVSIKVEAEISKPDNSSIVANPYAVNVNITAGRQDAFEMRRSARRKRTTELLNPYAQGIDENAGANDSLSSASIQYGGAYAINSPYRPEIRQSGEKFSVVNVVLTIGVVFILLAGLIFATSTWRYLGDFVRLSLIFGVSILFFAVSVFTEKKLKLSSTGKAFYILGSLFIAFSIICAGFFELFGTWFAIGGGGESLLLSVGIFMAGAAGLVGLLRYKQPMFFWQAVVLFEISAFLGINQFYFKFLEWDLFFRLVFAGIYLLVFYIFPAFDLEKIAGPLFKKQVETASLLNFYFFLSNIIFSANNTAGLVSSIFALIMILLAIDRRKLKFGWHIVAFNIILLVKFFESLIVNVNSTYRSIAVVIIYTLAFFAFRYLSSGKGLSKENWVSNIVFPAMVLFIAIENSSSRLFIVYVLLLSIMCVATALRKLENKSSLVCSYLCFTLPYFIVPAVEKLFWPNKALQPFGQPWLLISIFSIVAVMAVYTLLFKNNRFSRRLGNGAFIAVSVSYLFVVIRALYIHSSYVKIVLFIACVIYFAYLVFCLLKAGRDESSYLYRLSKSVPYALLLCFSFSSIIYTFLFVISISFETASYILAGLFIAFMLLHMLYSRKTEADSKRIKAVSWYWIAMSQLFLLNLFIVSVPDSYSRVKSFAFLAFLLVNFIILYLNKKHIANILAPLLLYFTVSYALFGSMNIYLYRSWLSVVMFVVYGVVSLALYRQVVSFKAKPPVIDWFMVFSLMIPMHCISAYDEYTRFIGFIMLSLWPLLIIKRLNVMHSDNIAATLITFMLLFDFWFQPFFDFPAMLSTEIIMLSLIGAFAILYAFIWRSKRKFLGWVIFAISVLFALMQIANTFTKSYVWDGIFLTGAATLIFLFSLAYKRKRWFTLGLSVLVITLLYHTIGFWLSIAWWIYLLAAGILLIVLAAANENQKQKGSSVAQRIKSSAFISSWEW